MMQISIINGTFSAKDTLDLLSQFIRVKIEFHESKMQQDDNEEDLKMREIRIKELQEMLSQARMYIQQQQGDLNLLCQVEIES